MWINVENKYPISKDPNDELYAVLPHSSSVRIVNKCIIIQLHNSVAKLCT